MVKLYLCSISLSNNFVAPIIYSVSPSSLPTTGGVLVVRGINFGESQYGVAVSEFGDSVIQFMYLLEYNDSTIVGDIFLFLVYFYFYL